MTSFLTLVLTSVLGQKWPETKGLTWEEKFGHTNFSSFTVSPVLSMCPVFWLFGREHTDVPFYEIVKLSVLNIIFAILVSLWGVVGELLYINVMPLFNISHSNCKFSPFVSAKLIYLLNLFFSFIWLEYKHNKCVSIHAFSNI